MKRFFRIVKKVFGLASTGWALRFGAVKLDPPRIRADYDQYTQRLEGHQKTDTIYDNEQSVRVITGSGTILEFGKKQTGPSEALKVRCGDLGKSGPGARAKAAARRNAKAGKFSSGSIVIPGASGYVPQKTYCLYHKNRPLSCRPEVKVSNDPFSRWF